MKYALLAHGASFVFVEIAIVLFSKHAYFFHVTSLIGMLISSKYIPSYLLVSLVLCDVIQNSLTNDSDTTSRNVVAYNTTLFAFYYHVLSEQLSIEQYKRYVHWFVLTSIVTYIWVCRLQFVFIPSIIVYVCTTLVLTLTLLFQYLYVKWLPIFMKKEYPMIDIIKSKRLYVLIASISATCTSTIITPLPNNERPFANTLNFYSISVTALVLFALTTVFKRCNLYTLFILNAICSMVVHLSCIYEIFPEVISNNSRIIIQISHLTLVYPALEYILIYEQNVKKYRVIQVILYSLPAYIGHLRISDTYIMYISVAAFITNVVASKYAMEIYREDMDRESCTNELV